MIVDAHSHLVDRAFLERLGMDPERAKIPKELFDVEALLDEQARSGIDVSIISGPRIMEAGVERAKLDPVDVARSYNDFVADLAARHPKAFAGLGIAHPMMGGERMLREMERAVKELGLRGFMVVPSYGEQYLDAPGALPFFELCQALDAVVFVHSRDGCLGEQYMGDNRLVELVGRPNEMTLLAARIVFSGLMERLPGLKLLLGRLGGAITMYAGRIQQGWETRHTRTSGIPPWGPDNLRGSFIESLRRINVDTQTFHAPAILCAVQTLGDDRVLLGTDFPPVPRDGERRASIEDVVKAGLSPESQRKILGANAVRLFRLAG
jgi:predicted TIM-barrel fold metal-dependent hydrolase